MNALLLSPVVLLGGALLPLLSGRKNQLANGLGAAAGLAGAGLGLTGALTALLAGTAAEHRYAWLTAGLDVVIRIDGLAAFFLVPLFLAVAVAALYATRYLDLDHPSLQAARHWFSFNLLAASMTVVVLAADSLLFLIAWELMSLSSFLLVVHDLEDEQTRRAGWIYFVATHLGTAFLFVLFLEGSRVTGSMDFASFAALGSLPVGTTGLFFILALLGFGTKAGLFPLHAWLPEAHSAAPSHVSALMSGVMVKTAVYAFLRMLTFLPPLPSWCGLLVAILGIAGALFGIAMASMQTDIKRSLAYSTVENIGIIHLAIGVWLYGINAGFAAAAILVLAGGLLHVWNHSLFKCLLFMAAGSVLHATGSREMSALGGLLRRMPMTGALLIAGGAAVSALPPFNGLIGELLIYLGLLQAGQTATGVTAFLFMILTIMLAMVGGMVLLTMTRMIGITMSGEPRSTAGLRAHESPPAMLLAMAVPALLCLAIGSFPQTVVRPVRAALAVLAPAGMTTVDQSLSLLPFGFPWSIAALTFLIIFGLVLVKRYTSRGTDRIGTWGCGFIRPQARMSYTAGGFGQLVQDDVYCSCLRPEQEKTARPTPLFPETMRLLQQHLDPILSRLITAIFTRCAESANACRRLQAGQLGIYMMYFFLATVLLLGWAVFSSQGDGIGMLP